MSPQGQVEHSRLSPGATRDDEGIRISRNEPCVRVPAAGSLRLDRCQGMKKREKAKNGLELWPMFGMKLVLG